VSELGDLLELLYRADSSWRTIRLSAQEWSHIERTQRAFERYYAVQNPEGGGHVVSLYGSDARDAPQEVTTELRLWAAADGRRRIERESAQGSYSFVFDGNRCWTHTPEFGAIVHESRTMRDEVDEILNSRALIDALMLSVIGTDSFAGRPALSVRGRPRSAGTVHAALIPPGVDEVTLLVDSERGIVLRSEAFLDGEPVRRLDIAEVAYDEEVTPATFVYEAPPGEQVRTQEEAFRVDYVSLEEAARRASFTVWRPRNLAPGWKVLGMHSPRSDRPALDESVHLLFHDDALHSFTIEQSAERLLAWRRDAPEVLVREGIELRVFPVQRPGPPAEVQLERDGTHLRVSSDSLPAGDLVDLAATLVPASTEPPPLLAE
jgi:outer membrane lipoprotein-sorting protein